MPAFQRCYIYLKRNLLKSAMFCLVFMGLTVAIIVNISIISAAKHEIQRIRSSLGSNFVLEVEFDNPALYETYLSEDGRSLNRYIGPTITNDMIKDICAVDGVDDYTIDAVQTVWTDLKLISGMWTNSNNNEWADFHMGITNILPCKTSKLHEYFRMGAVSLVEGRHLLADDYKKAIVSDKLAEINGLTLGDTVCFERKVGIQYGAGHENAFDTVGEKIEVEIIGIYSANFEQEYADNLTAECNILENNIFVDLNIEYLLRSYLGQDPSKLFHNRVTFFTSDPDKLSTVMEQVQQQGEIASGEYILRFDDTTYSASMRPIKFIVVLCEIFLFVFGLASVLILVLFIQYKMQSRKREMGILKSYGISTRNIMFQILLEHMVIITIAVMLSNGLGNPMVNFIGDMVEKLAVMNKSEEEYFVEQHISGGALIIQKNATENINLSYRTKPLYFFIIWLAYVAVVKIKLVCFVYRIRSEKLITLINSS